MVPPFVMSLREKLIIAQQIETKKIMLFVILRSLQVTHTIYTAVNEDHRVQAASASSSASSPYAPPLPPLDFAPAFAGASLASATSSTSASASTLASDSKPIPLHSTYDSTVPVPRNQRNPRNHHQRASDAASQRHQRKLLRQRIRPFEEWDVEATEWLAEWAGWWGELEEGTKWEEVVFA